MNRYGAVELGGTRAVISVGSGPLDYAPPITLPTTTPEETLGAVCQNLADLRDAGWTFDRIGVASFGPVGVHPDRDDYGQVLTTPKPGWSGVHIAECLREALGVEVLVETDVNGAAIAEGHWGASRGLQSHAYVTVGTGVGFGLVVEGQPLHGLMHSEGGHIEVRRDHDPTDFPGICAWHGDCLAGLVSGPALWARLGFDPAQAAADHPIWAIVGDYLGRACATLSLVASPERIVLGGGVGVRQEVLAAARQSLERALNGFPQGLSGSAIDAYLVAPALAPWSGLFGAMALAATVSASSGGECLQSIA